MNTDNLWDYTPLKSYLSELATFEEQEWEFLNELLYIKQFDTKEYFHRAGRQCKTIGFILNGCFRWVKNLNGVERTFDFAIENDFVTDYVSIMMQKPGEMDIIAVEKTTLICMDADRMLKLFDRSFSWQKAGRHLAEHTACYAMERLVASYYETPQIRYERLIQTSPELFLRIPHHILANYLGITKETLSRLRNTNK
ncbi:Crp/Fnr family transcriptional regulator [Chitinophaga sp. HK235]|uniref:Crp/Fnr family transcriptional regulator n=1 Tax=Chitinophaga sp. HK235 TaxID=2952571 RepID=UPI001BAC37F1|nr:cyclic nucleotide-binding domain-containing protein [Chitinophaga sp. HK235]